MRKEGNVWHRQIIKDIDAFVWGPPMIAILLGSHVFLTFRTGVIQRKLPKAIKLSVTKDPDAEGDISQFGALCTALSATIGTGNIVGVATAILSGGPGAVLWDVAHRRLRYRHQVFGNLHCGEVSRERPQRLHVGRRHVRMEARVREGRRPRGGGCLVRGAFALFAAIASFGIGSAVQSGSMTGVITANMPGRA